MHCKPPADGKRWRFFVAGVPPHVPEEFNVGFTLRLAGLTCLIWCLYAGQVRAGMNWIGAFVFLVGNDGFRRFRPATVSRRQGGCSGRGFDCAHDTTIRSHNFFRNFDAVRQAGVAFQPAIRQRQRHFGDCMNSLPPVLTIAGSDSGGGAGIQADLKTFAMLGTYGASVITALTAQNTMGVTGITAPEPEFVAKQLKTVLDDIPIRAGKTGMLFSEDIINILADVLDTASFPLVVDPVCVATSGDVLLKPDALGALKERIIPKATILTPNRQEAELLSGRKIDRTKDCFAAIERLLDMGAEAVLLKGGHFDESPAMTDWLGMRGHDPLPMIQPRVETNNTHGTGCTLSAAIAAGLAKGNDLLEAVRRAQEYMNLALRTSFVVGQGKGPVNHASPLLLHQGTDKVFKEVAKLERMLCGTDKALNLGRRLRGCLGMNVAVSLPGGCRPEHVAALDAPMVPASDGRLRSPGCPGMGTDEHVAKALLAVRAVYPGICMAVAIRCFAEDSTNALKAKDTLDLEGLIEVEVPAERGESTSGTHGDHWISSNLTMNWDLHKAVADAGLESAPRVMRTRGGMGVPDTVFCFANEATELFHICLQLAGE